MPIENIEAERLRKTFLRICGDKVNNSKSGDKESFNKKPYFVLYSAFLSIRRMLSESWLNSASPTTSPKFSNGSGKSMRIWMVKSTSTNSLWCTSAASLIKLAYSPVTFSTLFSFWCTISLAEIKSLWRTLFNWFMFVTLTQIYYNSTSLRSLGTKKRRKTGKNAKFCLKSISNRCVRTI
jgi:hypothetical protein